jgi:hypothetical protein
LCEKLVNVVIPHSLSSTTFDHKNVNLIFAKKKGNFKFFVKDTYLDNDEFKCTVHLAVVECYVQHATIDNNFSDQIKDGVSPAYGYKWIGPCQVQQRWRSRAQTQHEGGSRVFYFWDTGGVLSASFDLF